MKPKSESKAVIINQLKWKMLHDKWDSKEIDNLNEMK